MHHGVIHKADFKIVYVAPMKVGQGEGVDSREGGWRHVAGWAAQRMSHSAIAEAV